MGEIHKWGYECASLFWKHQKSKIHVFGCDGIWVKVKVWPRRPKSKNCETVRVWGRFLGFVRVWSDFLRSWSVKVFEIEIDHFERSRRFFEDRGVTFQDWWEFNDQFIFRFGAFSKRSRCTFINLKVIFRISASSFYFLGRLFTITSKLLSMGYFLRLRGIF